VLAVTGITNKSLRALMTGLLGGATYTRNQASYDLARLRVNAPITRIPGKNRPSLTRADKWGRHPRVISTGLLSESFAAQSMSSYC